MRKILSLMLAVVLMSSVSFAQTNTFTSLRKVVKSKNTTESIQHVPSTIRSTQATTVASINESFETWPPVNWTFQSPDGGTGWEQATDGATPNGWNGGSITVPTDGGSNVAYCTYSTGGPASNDQYIITPQVSIATGFELKYWISLPSSYEDNVDVLLSTTGNQTADFTTTLTSYTATTAMAWTSETIDLSAYVGQDVYIAFREHVADNQTNGGYIMLDLVSVGAGVTNPDLVVTPSGFASEYYAIPLEQATFIPMGNVKNNGTELTDAVNMDLAITGGFTGSQAITTPLANGSDEDLSFASFTAASAGTYTFDYAVTYANDADASDNTFSKDIEVGMELVRDNGIASGNIGVGTPGGEMGNVFTITAQDDITSIKWVMGGTAGDEVAAIIREFTTEPTTEVARTFAVTNNGSTEYEANIIGGSAQLQPGTYFIGVIEGDNNVQVEFTTTPYIDGTAWAYFSNAWNDLGTLNFNHTYHIRPVFDIPASCPAPGAVALDSKTNVSATISWVSSATNFEYEVVATGTTPTGTGTATTDNPLTLNGLTANTTYDFYVRADCSGDYSAWSSPLTFSTDACADMCNLTFVVTDSYGDGWNDAYISVMLDGAEIAQISNTSDAAADEAQTYLVPVCPGLPLELVYVSGSYDSEVSFTVNDVNGEIHNVAVGAAAAGSFYTGTTNCTLIPIENDIAMISVDMALTLEQGSINIVGTMKNFDNQNPLTTYDVVYSIDGTPSSIYNVTGISLNVAEENQFTHDVPWIATPGEHTIEVTISNPNGNTDINTADNMMSHTILIVNEAYPRVAIYEEGTGTWCGWCVRGLVGLSTMAHDITDGSWIGIGVHNNDPMTVTEYDAAVGTFISGYPSGIMNRYPIDIDPGLASLQAYYGAITAMVPEAKVEITGQTWNTTTRDFTVDVTSTFALDLASADYNAAVIVVEDGVTGTGSGWEQANYYSNGNPMTDWDGTDYTALPDPIPAADMVYNHVGRQLIGGWAGATGSIPASVTYNVGNTYTFSGNIPADNNEMHTHYVAIIINNTDGTIVNATSIDLDITSGIVANNANFKLYPNPTTGLVKVEGIEGAQVIVYNMIGEVVYNEANAAATTTMDLSSLQSGNYIVKVINNDEVSTQKIVLTK